MKSITSTILLSCAVLICSCEGYLDKTIMTNTDESFTFETYNNAVSVAYSMYADLPQGLSAVYGDGGSAMMASACDEAEFAIQTNNVQKFNLGNWRPADMPDNPFSTYYASIRKAYDFIENCDKINFDSVKDNPAQPGTYEEQLQDIGYLKTEVMLLRAYYMFELIKRFGGVPIISGKLSNDMDYSTLQRASLQDCIDEILYWCDYAADPETGLPVRHIDTRLGRLTAGAAKAIKSEVLLFAASDLWNDDSWATGYAHPEYISLPEGDRKARWKAAADAAKDVIDMETEAGYVLDGNLSDLYSPQSYLSPEIIMAKRDGASNSFEKINYPISFNHATGGNCPSQNIVDMFQILDGSGNAVDFDWTDPDMAADPYANRDPRLAVSVLTNNSTFKGQTVECWTGGRDGAGVRNATPTGYYLRKYVNPDLNLDNDQTSVHTWILIRLAEIYLNYIEALNEYDPGNADIKIYYDKIRNRAGMPGLPSGLNQNQVRELIRQERAVELCFEGKRFWDLRRWMDKESLTAPLRAVEITRENDGTFTYKPYELETRTFEDKMYFYPIPQQELLKMPHWAQNPLWN